MPNAAHQEALGSVKDWEARCNQRIGLATAKSVRDPWIRRDQSILLPMQGEWDGLMTDQPAPCVLPVVYRLKFLMSDIFLCPMT
jgi:hypothetical protein